ncbi:MAG TPA: molybdopterin dinucleotide binding domain-containing protein, partial [Geobacteraceae bacterium]
EPVESPVDNILHPKVPINPCLKYPRMKALQPIGTKKDYPIVLSTSSLAEHWCCGAFTRNVPWLNEIQPETYVEIPEALAKKISVSTGDKVKVWSARGEVVVPAMVTKRMETLKCNGQEVFVIWMPYNWGFKGLSQAASTNLITIDAGDPNTWVQETKACLVNVAKA